MGFNFLFCLEMSSKSVYLVAALAIVGNLTQINSI